MAAAREKMTPGEAQIALLKGDTQSVLVEPEFGGPAFEIRYDSSLEEWVAASGEGLVLGRGENGAYLLGEAYWKVLREHLCEELGYRRQVEALEELFAGALVFRSAESQEESVAHLSMIGAATLIGSSAVFSTIMEKMDEAEGPQRTDAFCAAVGAANLIAEDGEPDHWIVNLVQEDPLAPIYLAEAQKYAFLLAGVPQVYGELAHADTEGVAVFATHDAFPLAARWAEAGIGSRLLYETVSGSDLPVEKWKKRVLQPAPSAVH